MKIPAWSRLAFGLVVTILFMTRGDSAQSQVVTTLIGVDPLAILDLQVKPNILIVVDTSGSMRFPPNTAIGGSTADLNIGGDDPVAKMYQAKSALKTVLDQNKGKVNFGLASYGLLNSNKRLNEPSYQDSNRAVGPLTYVSLDANADTWTGGSGGATSGQGTVPDYFTTGNTGAYLGTSAANVFNSFRPFNQVYPGSGCAAGTNCRYYLFSRILRNNLVFRFNLSTGLDTAGGYPKAYSCPLPPVGLFPDDTNTDADPTRTDIPRPCFRLETTATGNPGAVFYYSSGIWEMAGGANSCSASANLATVTGCATDNTDTIKGFLKPEMPIDGSCGDTVGIPCRLGTGNFVNNTTSTFDGRNPAADQSPTGQPNSDYGIIASQATPLAGVLNDVRNNFATFFPNAVTGQANYVLLLTDGDDTCAGDPTNDPPNAARANWTNSTRIGTFVIGFGLNSTVLNNIAQAGSGGTLSGGVWSGGQNAYTALNTQDLVDKLNAVITQASVTGEFSDSQTVTESVFEYGATAGVDPRDPTLRYSQTVPLLLQSTFEMPGFIGHLNAFRNNGGSSLQVWDAGDKLCQAITGFPATTVLPAKCNVPTGAAGQSATVMGNQSFPFNPGGFGSLAAANTLTGAAVSAPDYVQTSGRLRRRIFTTTRNGVFPYAYNSVNVAGASQLASDAGPSVALYPPSRSTTGVDPDKQGSNYPAGVLDTALGIGTLSFATLQSSFGACVKSGTDVLPADCTNAARQLGLAMKEAREMIIAFTAGAAAVRDAAGKPRRDASGNVLYAARTWLLAEGTLSGPALSTPPLYSSPTIARSDYEQDYRDGPKQPNGTPFSAPGSQVDLGFGLRNPDLDSNTATATASRTNANLKPVMSVVYYGANDMLHAFRAGPACAVIGSTTSCPSTFDTGGEELWGFIPYDQLGKLQLIMLQGQDRANHKFIVASAIRFGDVFVPGSFNDPSSTGRAGHWRRLLFFGRGIGGKYYTALDVTAPGVFTQAAATTHAPLPVWNRGNPDTQDGTPSGSANSLTNTPRTVLNTSAQPVALAASDQGVADATAYATMGQTWSVPALAYVDRSKANTFGHDFVLYMGSGYRQNAAAEGRSFYAVDALTGDVLTSVDVGSNATSLIADNAIVASPAVFNSAQLSYYNKATGTGSVGHPATQWATRVYVGDLHGRLWKFLTVDTSTAIRVQDFGASQPIANAAGLINYDGGTGMKPHIYVETGNDRRIPPPPTLPPPPNFQLVGLEDNGSDTDTTTDNATVLFTFVLPDRYRGTVQPATAFVPDPAGNGGLARVFLVGTRFNPLSVTGTCQSSFDSIVYAASGQTGSAVYDMNGSGTVDNTDLSKTMTNARVNAVSVTFGQVNVDQGLQAQNAPPPPSPPTVGMSNGARSVYVQTVFSGGSPVCR